MLPLALDDSADPDLARRAAQELLVDPAVVAVIGPFPFASIEPVAAVMATTDLPWIVPGLVDPAGGFADPAASASAWAAEMVAAVIAADAPARVLLAGLPAQLAYRHPGRHKRPCSAWRTRRLWTAAVLPGDTVLWFAAPAAGAAWHTAPSGRTDLVGRALWRRHLDAPDPGGPRSALANMDRSRV